MNLRVSVLTLSLLMASALTATRAEKPDGDKPSIVDDITADSVNIVIQDEEIARLLEYSPVEKKQDRRAGNIGYRVQVFSDNNVRTARNEARTKQRSIKSRFPQYDSYVTYNQPYWRLRVGDFKTQEEASAFMTTLQRAFPAYAREMRVVRDRIKVTKD